MKIENNLVNDEDLVVYPLNIPHLTYGISEFWAEEYWAWRKIQIIRKKYPQLDLKGLINENFEKTFPNIIKHSPHIGIIDTSCYKDIPLNSWHMKRKKINLATSHAPSRLKALEFLEKYPDDFRIINFDAHIDIGESLQLSGAWLTEELATRSTIIGAWSESETELNYGKTFIPFISLEFREIKDKKEFLDWISGKKVYVTIDLDFFPLTKEYLGLSNYRHRNFFIGHSMNLNQRIQLNPIKNPESYYINIGSHLKIFDNLDQFYKEKHDSIKIQMELLKGLIVEIYKFFNDYSVKLLELDLVEYSPLCDWRNLTINHLIDYFPDFQRICKSI